MLSHLLRSHIGIAAATTMLLAVPLGTVYASNQRTLLVGDLDREARILAGLADTFIAPRPEPELLDQLVAAYRGGTNRRAVIFDRDGQVIADSFLGAPDRDVLARQPEVLRALKDKRSVSTVRSIVLNTTVQVVTVPVLAADGRSIDGVVRVSEPTRRTDQVIRRAWLLLALVGLSLLLPVTILSLALARRMARPVHAFRDAVQRIGGDDLASRVPTDTGIREISELAVAFNNMAERLEVLQRSQRRFVADASHELRTPLTALRLQIEGLEAGQCSRCANVLARARREVERLQHLVESLLILARSDFTPVHGLTSATDVLVVLNGRLANWSAHAATKNVAITMEVESVNIAMPSLDLEIVMDNLLSNAVRASPTGGRIVVQGLEKMGECHLHVVDEGPGLTAEERSQAFERFWRGGKEPNTLGSGIGLSIVRALVDRAGGSVALQTSDNGGIDAFVLVPRAAA